MGHINWKQFLFAGAALTAGCSCDHRGVNMNIQPTETEGIHSLYMDYLARHDTVAYLWHTLWPKTDSMPPELPQVPGAGLVYGNQVCAYGKVIRVEPFRERGDLYLIDVEELFWGSASDTLRIYLADRALFHGILPCEGNRLFVGGESFPYWFLTLDKDARDSLAKGIVPDPCPGGYHLGTWSIVFGDTMDEGYTVEEFRAWLREAAAAKGRFIGGR